MQKKQRLLIVAFFLFSTFLSGCAAVAVGGAAVATASVVHDRRSSGQVVDDHGIEAKITKALYASPEIDDYSHTNLTVFNGVVLVTGEAASEDIKTKIVNIAQSVEGVKRVEADLLIGPTSSVLSRGTDSTITGKVKTALLSLDLPDFDTTLVNVSTERGKVYIMGIVSHAEADAIVEKARYVSGVQSVTKVFEYTD